MPFYFEYELRARHPRGVIARLSPYDELLLVSNEHKEDQPPYPVTLFVVDTEEVEDTYVRTAARMSRMSLPIFVSCIPAAVQHRDTWTGHGVHCGNRSLLRLPLSDAALPTSGTHSTTGCVTVL